jgi:lipid A 3-O-deacylase
LREYGVTRLLDWRPLPGVPVVAFALVLSLELARGADLLPASQALAPPAAGAAPPLSRPPAEFYDPGRMEFRLGAFLHGIGGTERGTYDLNPEFVLPRLPVFSNQWWNAVVPRPHVGAHANLEGRTSFVYGGALWTFPLPYRTFFEFFVDGALHNGVESNPLPGHAGLGCPALFHVGGSLGYAITEHWSAMVTFDHMSNGHSVFGTQCAGNPGGTPNPGLNNWGGRIGYAF